MNQVATYIISKTALCQVKNELLVIHNPKVKVPAHFIPVIDSHCDFHSARQRSYAYSGGNLLQSGLPMSL
jgi:hypothetical protein